MRTNVVLGLCCTVLSVAISVSSCKKKESAGPDMPSFTMAFSEEEISLEEGKNKNLANLLVIEPKSVADTLTVEYSTSNKKVATVSSTGRVKALYEGRATITASACGQSAEISVRVKPVKIEEFTVPSGTVDAAVNVPLVLEIGIVPEEASPGHLQVSVSPDNAQLKFEDNVWKFKTADAGLYTITVTDGETTRNFAVQARVIAVETVSLSKSMALIEINDVLTLTAAVSPDNATDKTLTWTSSDNTVATVANGVCRGLKKGQTTITATASNGRKGTCLLKVTDQDLSKVALFSVGEGTKVSFSPGNLQFTTSGTHAGGGASKQGTFRFAPTQYTMVGSDNSLISSTYTGWIDLFGSGTTGCSSSAQPWTSSGANYNYSSIGSSSYDWGRYNEITNGSEVDPAGQWRVLTRYEWEYLLESRPNAANLYGTAQVNGVCGLVLLPDNWTAPTGVSFTPGLSTPNVVSAEKYAGVNNLTVGQWETLEAKGAVFLPSAGSRDETTLESSLIGVYWTSTQWTGYQANYVLNIYPYSVTATSTEYYHMGCSVRLVQDF